MSLTADGGLVYQAGGPMAFEAGRDLLVVYDGDKSALMEVAAKVPKNFPRIETGDEPMRQARHRMSWANAIMGKAKNTCPFEYAGRP